MVDRIATLAHRDAVRVGASIPLHTDYLHALVFQHLGHAWNWVDTQISQSPQCIGDGEAGKQVSAGAAAGEDVVCRAHGQA